MTAEELSFVSKPIDQQQPQTQQSLQQAAQAADQQVQPVSQQQEQVVQQAQAQPVQQVVQQQAAQVQQQAQVQPPEGQQQAQQQAQQQQAQQPAQGQPAQQPVQQGQQPADQAQPQQAQQAQAQQAQQAPGQVGQPSASRNALGIPRNIADAAQKARERAREGFTSDDFRRELVRARRVRRRHRVLIGILCVVVAIVVALVVLLNTVFGLRVVQTSAMEPAMYYGQAVVLEHPQTPAVGDVVAYEANGYTVFKRIIAAPGNWVSIMGDGSLVISEEAVDNSTANGAVKTSSDIKISRQVPEGSYYVLGDSQSPTISGLANSEDFVASNRILGKAMFRIWPITAIGSVQ